MARPARTALLIALCLVLLGAGCAGGDPAATASATAAEEAGTGPTTTTGDEPEPTAGADEVRVLTEVLVDPTRPTEAGGATPELPERTLQTRVYLPPGGDPAPLVVFSHGLSGHPDDFTRLLGTWAEAGYLVAAPVFPLTNREVPESARNLGDVVNQAGDVAFVIDEVVALGEAAEGPLAGRVDPGRIGTAGLSLGGITTGMVALDACCADERIDAAVVLAGSLAAASDEAPFTARAGIPVLLIHGDADLAIPYSAAFASYELLGPPRALVTLFGGGHAEPFGDTPTPFDTLVDRITTSFWDLTLGEQPDAAERFLAAVEGSELAQIEAEGW